MAELKLVINNTKTGKSYQKVLPNNSLINKKAGEKIKGELIDLPGYELQITGATSNAGIPMRADLQGIGKRKVLLSKGPCVTIKRKGMRKRKTVVANTINEAIAQVNLKVTEYGTQNLEDILGKKEEAPIEQKIEA